MRLLLTADPELPVPPRLYGGIERIVDLLVRGLRQRGHVVGLCAHRDSTTPADELFAWPGESSASRTDTPRNMSALHRAVRRFRPDVVHSFSRLWYLLPILPTAVPKVMSYQRTPSLRTTAWARRLSRGTLTFTGCSDFICRLGRRGRGDWITIHNSVDLSRFTFRPQTEVSAPLVFLSRIERIKGAHTAIEIARRAGHRLLIAGNHASDGSDGRYWTEVIQPALRPGEIEYVGPVDDRAKNDLLGSASGMIVPIEWEEPFGIVFTESLACGTPVISCPRGALPELVTPGLHGFLIGSVEEGVDAVRRLGSIQRTECRRRIEDRFSGDLMVTRYETLYAKVLQNASAGNSESMTPARAAEEPCC